MSRKKKLNLAFQGKMGAFSHCACLKYDPHCEVTPCESFSKAFEYLQAERVDAAMLPIRNSIAGRVPDIHQILPQTNFFMTDELFLPVNLCLLAGKRASIETVQKAYSHPMALRQCQDFLQQHNIERRNYHDTAAAAQMVAQKSDAESAAICSQLAAEFYGLKIIKKEIQDSKDNFTRFVVFNRTDPKTKRIENKKYITTFLFRVHNIPAALYKALGGFATNYINMLTLESYQLGNFQAAQFYAEIDAHPDDLQFKQAFKELNFYTDMIKIIGVFPASEQRDSSLDNNLGK